MTFGRRDFGNSSIRSNVTLTMPIWKLPDTDLSNLTFRNGVLLSAQVGDGGKGVGTMLRKPQPRDLSWIDKPLSRQVHRITRYS